MDSPITQLMLKNSLGEIVLLTVSAFLIAMALTPIYTFMAYRYKFWKKQRQTSTTGEVLEVFTKLHEAKFKRSIPTMAGAIGVLGIIIVTLAFNWDYGQTLLPLVALVGGALVGLADDIINIRGSGNGVAGLRSSIKFLLIIGLGVGLGWYFYDKLEYTSVLIPYFGTIDIGLWMIPLFAFVVTAMGNAVNISDGLDGLAGGLLVAAYGAFGLIAILQGHFPLAGFCFTVIGVLLSYLWFNIYPARFFMGDVGSFAYGIGLGVVAMMTNSLLLLPVIGAVFVLEAGSSLIQIVSKRFFHRKVFISAPIHHHLEASGWPEVKITMRFWVLGCVAASVGMLISVSGGYI